MNAIPHPSARRLLAGATGLLVTLALAVVGAARPASADPVRQAATPRDQQIEQMLAGLVRPTLMVAQTGAVRDLVYSMAAEQFDGDTNVLFESLIARAEQQGAIDPANAQWQQIKAGVAAFTSFTGGTYKPQIYLPFFDQVARGGLLTVGHAPQDESVQTTYGQRYSIIFRPIFNIDESYMLANETWILSINERVDWTVTDIETSKKIDALLNGTNPRAARTSGGFGTFDTNTPCNPSGYRLNRGREFLEYVLIEDPRHWEGIFQGKLDMRVQVFGGNGVRGSSYDFGIGRTNSNWNDIGHEMGTWDRAVHGDLWAWLWTERDSGDTTNVNYTIPNTGTTVSYSRSDKDDDLGITTVNFSDNHNVSEYNTGQVASYMCGVGGDGNTGNANHARTAQVWATSTYGSYSAQKTIDGDTNTALGEPNSWANARYAPMPQSLTYELGTVKTINRIVLYTTATYPIKEFRIRYWDDTRGWVEAAHVTNNTDAVITVNLPVPMTTRQVAMDGYSGPDHQPGYVRVNEFELYT